MARTAVALIQELANRMGELALFTGTTLGTTTTVVSTGLDQYIPQPTQNMAAWVYCLTGTGNLGLERRAKSYSPSTDTLTLHAPGFPVATPLNATYELHARTKRARKLEAINSAIRQLGLYWPRDVVDTSLIGVADQHEYTLPSTTKWQAVTNVQVQSIEGDTDSPYDEARPLHWDVRRAMSSAGVETWTLIFSSVPTTDHVLRVSGSAFFSELAVDADVLPIGGQWEGTTLEWIMDWGKFKLLDETTDRQPGGEAERYRQRAQDMLTKTKNDLVMSLKPKGGNKMQTPWSGSSSGRGGVNLAEFNIFGLAREFS